MKIVSARFMLKFDRSNSVRMQASPVEAESMHIRVLLFAGLREAIGAPELSLTLPQDACVDDAWKTLVRDHPALDEVRRSTRAARNGRLVSFEERLLDGDELALLPPVGGG
jgi:MoaE-MoaD fusion protein